MVCSYFSTVFIEFVLGVHRCFQCFYLCFHCLSILHGFVAMIFVDFHVFNGLEPKNKNIIYVYIYITSRTFSPIHCEALFTAGAAGVQLYLCYGCMWLFHATMTPVCSSEM